MLGHFASNVTDGIQERNTDLNNWLYCRRDALHVLRQLTTSGRINSSQHTLASDCWKASLLHFVNLPLDFRYGSHVIPLLASFWVTDGAILELGSGWYSTPMAHRIAQSQHRYVLTADCDPNWLKLFTMFATSTHDFYLVNVTCKRPILTPYALDTRIVTIVSDWASVGHQRNNWSVIFVDHAPLTQRYIDLERLRSQADLLVIHDTEHIAPNKVHNQTNILRSFPFSYSFADSTWSKASTDVVSENREDLVAMVQVLTSWGTDTMRELTNT
jgi:hypothetical protein